MFKKILLLVFGLFFLSAPLWAQEAAKNKIVVLDDFSGGLATKPSPFSLSPSQATICENVRLNDESRALSKRQQVMLYGTADAAEQITGMHRLYLKDGTKVLLVNHGDEIETGNDATGNFTNILNLTTGDYRWQWTTWNNIAIGTDGYNQPVKYDGTSPSATYLGTCLANATTTGTDPNGTYKYKVSFYTASYEVAFNVTSNTVYTANKSIALSMIPIGPDSYGGETVIGRYVYRNADNGTTWYRLSNGNITNNYNVTLTDSDSDTVLNATAYNVTYNCTPPKGRLALIHYNRLFLANNPTNPSRLYFSDDSNADYFLPTDYYLDIRPDDGDQITFAIPLLGILTVGKENSIQKVYTDGATPSVDWSISNVFSNIGCKAMYSAQNTPIGIIYLGNNGLYKFNGQYSILLSDIITPEIQDILESNRPYVWGIYDKSAYYLTYASKRTGVTTNNRVLLYDLISDVFSLDLLNANCFASFNSGTDWDTLYYGSSADGKVYQYTFQAYEINHRKHSDFTGTFTNARYIPVGIPGGDANAPVIEIARTVSIDDLTGIINDLIGTIDRDSLTGSYISQALNTGASKYDKLYWNEQFKSAGDDITLAIRSNTTEAGLTGASWSSEVTDPSGSDISGINTSSWTQYRISLTTDAYTHSPNLLNYVRLTYFKALEVAETTIPLHRHSGWLDFQPGYKKTLRKIQVYYSSESTGTLDLKFENFEGDTDTFEINLADNPSFYQEYFTNGAFVGELFNLDITESSLHALKINKIILVMDLEPLV